VHTLLLCTAAVGLATVLFTQMFSHFRSLCSKLSGIYRVLLELIFVRNCIVLHFVFHWIVPMFDFIINTVYKHRGLSFSSLSTIPRSGSGGGWLPKVNQFFLVHRYIRGKIFVKIEDPFSSFNVKLLTDKQTDKCRDFHNVLGGRKYVSK